MRWILFDLGGKWTFPIRVGGTLHLIAVGDGSTWREGAEQLRQEIDDDRRKAEAEAAQTPTNARAEASSTAGVDGAPTLQFYVVWGGPHEGVHGIFDPATELLPLIGMPGARAYGAADGVTSKGFAEAKLRALQNARVAQQWQNSPAPDRPPASPEEVAQGTRCVMTYPEARQAIANLHPTSPIRDIRHVIEAAGMPVSTAVGGRVQHSSSEPGKTRGRTRADILTEARGCLGMLIPPEWHNDEPVDRVMRAMAQTEVGDESGNPSATRREATSPLTLIDDMPFVTEKQVAGIAIAACILFATIAIVLATGVPIGPLCLAVVTYFGRATGAISGLRMVADAPADQTGLVTHSELDWARSTDAGAIFAAITAMMTIIMLTLHLLTEIGMLRGVITTLRWVVTAHLRAGRGLVRRVCRLPALIRVMMTAVGTSAMIMIMFCLVRGTDGKMTEDKVARARRSWSRCRWRFARWRWRSRGSSTISPSRSRVIICRATTRSASPAIWASPHSSPPWMESN